MEIRIQIDAMENLTEKLENACHIKNALLRGGEIVRPSYANIEEGLTMEQYEELKQEIRDLTETVKILTVELHDLKHPMIYNYNDVETMGEEKRKYKKNSGSFQG